MLLLAAFVYSFPTLTAQYLGASDTLMPQVLDYMMWIMPCFIMEMWSLIGLFIIRLDGSPRYAMWCNIIPSAANAILDWLFIFPLGMGVKGAAIATALSISLGGIMALVYLLGHRNARFGQRPNVFLQSRQHLPRVGICRKQLRKIRGSAFEQLIRFHKLIQ